MANYIKWDRFTTARDIDGLSFRQLHALCEDADCHLRGFAPNQDALIVLSMAETRLAEENRRRPVRDRCACVWCEEPFPDEEFYEL